MHIIQTNTRHIEVPAMVRVIPLFPPAHVVTGVQGDWVTMCGVAVPWCHPKPRERERVNTTDTRYCWLTPSLTKQCKFYTLTRRKNPEWEWICPIIHYIELTAKWECTICVFVLCTNVHLHLDMIIKFFLTLNFDFEICFWICLASCPPILADFSSFPWDSFLMEGSHFL